MLLPPCCQAFVLTVFFCNLHGIAQEHKSRFRSYVIDCHECSKSIKRIHDFVLLDGFYEPTIVLLHEPVVTWVGRYAVTRDTKAIAALSLNLSDQRNTLIWSVERLPSDVR